MPVKKRPKSRNDQLPKPKGLPRGRRPKEMPLDHAVAVALAAGMQDVAEKVLKDAPKSTRSHKASKATIQQLLGYIRGTLDGQEHSIADAATHFKMSEEYVTRRIHAITMGAELPPRDETAIDIVGHEGMGDPVKAERVMTILEELDDIRKSARMVLEPMLRLAETGKFMFLEEREFIIHSLSDLARITDNAVSIAEKFYQAKSVAQLLEDVTSAVLECTLDIRREFLRRFASRPSLLRLFGPGHPLSALLQQSIPGGADQLSRLGYQPGIQGGQPGVPDSGPSVSDRPVRGQLDGYHGDESGPDGLHDLGDSPGIVAYHDPSASEGRVLFPDAGRPLSVEPGPDEADDF
jgi:hypothetical protein